MEGVAVQIDDPSGAASAAGTPIDEPDGDAAAASAHPHGPAPPVADAKGGPCGGVHPARIAVGAGADACLAVPACLAVDRVACARDASRRLGRGRGLGRSPGSRGWFDFDDRTCGGLRVRTRFDRTPRRLEVEDRRRRRRREGDRPGREVAGRPGCRRPPRGQHHRAERVSGQRSRLCRGTGCRRGDEGERREGERQDQRGDKPAPQG